MKRTVLSRDDVINIIHEMARHNVYDIELAKKYKCSTSTIFRVKNAETSYKWIKTEFPEIYEKIKSTRQHQKAEPELVYNYNNIGFSPNQNIKTTHTINAGSTSVSKHDKEVEGEQYSHLTPTMSEILQKWSKCGVNWNELNIIKYAGRKKGGIEGKIKDLRKVIKYAGLELTELEENDE